MSAIPTSDMPGHRKLHDRVYASLDRCQESQAVEFKGSADWQSLKWHVICTTMAMCNLRDGGVIIVGASERGDTWDLSGIETNHLGTYDIDDIIDSINKYASPPIDIEIVLVRYSNQKTFLSIQVPEFEQTPCICKKNSPDDVKLFNRGDILIRPPGKPQTKKVEEAGELHDLLELAAEKRARRMIEAAHRIGFVPSKPASRRFDDELKGL